MSNDTRRVEVLIEAEVREVHPVDPEERVRLLQTGRYRWIVRLYHEPLNPATEIAVWSPGTFPSPYHAALQLEHEAQNEMLRSALLDEFRGEIEKQAHALAEKWKERSLQP